MARKVALLSFMIVLLGTMVYADICTVTFMAKAKSLGLKEISYTIATAKGTWKVLKQIH